MHLLFPETQPGGDKLWHRQQGTSGHQVSPWGVEALVGGFTTPIHHPNWQLQYLREAKKLNPRQARWALFFTWFNYSISYSPGPKNTKADALSHLQTPEETEEEPEPIIPEKLIVCPFQWNPRPKHLQCFHGHSAGLPTRSTICLPNSANSPHPANSTLLLLKIRYWWPNMARDVRRFVQGVYGLRHFQKPLPLTSRKAPPIAHSQPAMVTPGGRPFITDLPDSDGNTCILVIVDRFSKSCRLLSIRGLPTAMITAKLLFNSILRYFGIPEDIVSDWGPQLVSRVWKGFFNLLGVTMSLSSRNHPLTNGQAERKIQEIGRFLRTFCHGHQDSWNQFIDWAEYPQNSLRQPSTGFTPFQCVLGYQPPLFPWSGEPLEIPSVDYWFWESERVWDEAHHQLKRAVRRRKMTANLRRSEAPYYQPGQKVWLSTRDIRLCLLCKKLSPRYVGPFTILRQINPVTFQLPLLPQYRIHSTLHVSLLKPYHPPVSPSTEPGPSEEPPLPLILEDGAIYKVKKILDSRCCCGQLEYLVDWEDYGREERSWVPRNDILDPTLLEEFHSTHPNRPAPRGRGRPPRRRAPALWSGPWRGGKVTDRPGSHASQSQHTP